MRRWLGRFYFTGAFWYRFHYWAATRVPGWVLLIAAHPVILTFYVTLYGVRSSLSRNHRLIDPSAGWWRIQWRTYWTIYAFGWCLTERYQQFAPVTRLKITFEGRENWERARVKGQGLIVVTSHIGGWEIGSAVAPNESKEEVVHVVREREANSEAQQFVEGLLEDLVGERYITHFANDNPGLAMELYAALRDGSLVALQGDRPREGGQVERVQLFGAEVSLPPGPAQLAYLAKVPILPVFTLREGRSRYRVVFADPITVSHSGDRQADLHQAVQQLATVIEGVIREHPRQWFCFSDILAYEGFAESSK